MPSNKCGEEHRYGAGKSEAAIKLSVAVSRAALFKRNGVHGIKNRDSFRGGRAKTEKSEGMSRRKQQEEHRRNSIQPNGFHRKILPTRELVEREPHPSRSATRMKAFFAQAKLPATLDAPARAPHAAPLRGRSVAMFRTIPVSLLLLLRWQ